MEQLFIQLRRDAITMEKTKKTTQTLTITALAIAIRLVLEMLPSIKLGNITQIGFGFVGAALAGILLGPWRAAAVGFFVDILGTFLKGDGGIFFAGYTLTAIVGGLIYGYFLYKKPVTWQRITLTVLVITIVCNLGLNSIWVYMMTGKAFSTFMGARIIKNLISFPLNSFVLFLLFNNKTMQHLIEKYRV